MKHIKLTYSATLIFLIATFTYTQVKVYQHTQYELDTELGYYNNLFASTVNSTLHKIEILLDTLGYQLIFEQKHNNSESQAIMDEFLDRFDYLAGFLLYDPLGDPISSSSNIDIKEVSSLLENSDTKNNFLQTLSNEKMVIGKSYYNEVVQEWILPLRKAIKNSSGDVIGVVTTAILLEKSTNIFIKEKLYDQQISLLTKDDERSRVFVDPIGDNDFKKIYSTPVPKDISEDAATQIEKALGKPRDSILKTESSFHYKSRSNLTGQDSINVSVFISRYDLWATTMLPSDLASKLFFERSFTLKVFTFVATLILLITLFIIIYRKEEQVKKELSYKAIHDPLTSLYNRAALQELSKKWTKTTTQQFTLLFIDLDNFKNINDSFGHSYGDLLLKQVSNRITETLPMDSDVVRQGGDEFAIFTETNDETSLNKLCISLITNISNPYETSGMRLHLGASIGISRFPEDGVTLEQLMITADLALYEAKKRKNSHSYYNSELQKAMHRKTSIENRLRDAIQGEELYMVYQPQIAANGAIYGAEALIRWENSELGFVPPDQFIGIAEESGLMSSLGLLIIKKSCEGFREMIDQCGDLGRDLCLSINISVKQIIEKDFKNQLIEVIDHFKLDHSKVTIEITESLFIDELEYILPLLRDIRSTGVTISLDDFGTGYSSLSMLRTLPIDELKIDRSFINNINKVEQDSKIIKSIIDMGHTIETKIVAEGVEDETQIKLLRSYGCDLFQGYYFSKPLKKDSFTEYVENFYST